MKILSHRGAWSFPEEKNTAAAFEHSFKNGFGTETDLRDYNGRIVISHDMADEKSIPAEEFFKIYNSFDNTLPLALNVKSDGLQAAVKDLLAKFSITNYYFFDMSIPDTLGYLRGGMPVYMRQSEYEPQPALYDKADGIWLDAFEGTWYTEKEITAHTQNGKHVAIVSPDLHKREYKEHWQFLKDSGISTNDKVMLCTDFPFEANEFFEK